MDQHARHSDGGVGRDRPGLAFARGAVVEGQGFLGGDALEAGGGAVA